MPKNGNKKKQGNAVPNSKQEQGKAVPNSNAEKNGHKPWISMKTGLRIITAASIVMFILTAVQTVPALGWVEGLLYALLFGVLVWVIFFVTQLFFRWMRH
jgi:hypothetical protein